MSHVTSDLKQIFFHALEKETPQELREYIDRACGDDPELRRRVEALLTAHRKAGDFLGGLPSEDSTADYPATVPPGTRIGPYKLLQRLGEGGMGEVYMAEQTDPVQRRVAIKIIKAGMDTRQVIARFEAERQALAMMDHPNIAKVLDAGETESGRPYFVMELVNGLSVTEYCDRQQLTPKERLELFVPICQAVQHAHQKGIIHRDLKPSNILVALYDGKPVPKIIDFGVAKATSRALTEKTMFTELGQVVGTLEYMSPEQAERNQLDIDTRSDIYSLGVVLYELLTGESPFDRERLRSAAFDEILRIIREEEPSRPSVKLSTSRSLASIASNRHVEPKKLGAILHGELDWIIMKALEKNRVRRYETANGFASDIQRYLEDEPVEACPPSAAYRITKFARRNKAALLTAVVVTLTLLLGIMGTTWQAIEVTRSLRRAVEAETTARIEADRANREFGRANQEAKNARSEKAAAEAERLRAESNLALAMDALNELYLEAIGQDRLLGDRDRDETQRELSNTEKELIEAGLKFYKEIAGQNEASTAATFETAQAFLQIGMLRANLDDHEAADIALLEAIARLKKLTESLPDNANYFKQLGLAYYAKANLSRWWPKADDTFTEAVDAFSKSIELNPKKAELYELRAKAYERVSQEEKAYADLTMAAQLDPDNAFRHHALAWFLFFAGDPRVVDRAHALDCARTAVALNPRNAYLQATLGRFLAEAKKYQEALKAFDKAIELNPKQAYTYNQRAVVLRNLGQGEQALLDAEKALQLQPDDPWHLRRRAETFSYLGRYDEALADFSLVEERQPNERYLYLERGQIYQDRAEFELALRDYDRALELSPGWWWVYKRRAAIHFAFGRYEVALLDLNKAFERRPTDLSTLTWISPSDVANCPNENFQQGLLDLAAKAISHPDTDKLLAHRYRAELLNAMGRPEAIDDYTWLIDNLPKNGELYFRRARVYATKGEFQKAIVDFNDAIRLDPSKAWYYPHRAEAHLARGDYQQVLAEAEEMLQRTRDHSYQFHRSLTALAKAYEMTGQRDKGLATYSKLIERNPDAPELWMARADAYVRLRRWQEAVNDYDEAIRLEPTAQNFCSRAAAYAMQGNFEQAAADARRAVEIKPTNRLVWLMLLDVELARGSSAETTKELVAEADTALGEASSTLHNQYASWNLLSGCRSEYEAICREVFSRFDECRLCALTDKPVIPTTQLVQTAKRVVESDPAVWNQIALGYCLLRDGQEEAAIEWFSQSLGQNWHGEPLGWLGLAIAHAKVGNAAEAEDWLRKAQSHFAEHPLDLTSDMFPNARLDCQVLLREAEQLIEQKRSAENDGKKKTP